MKQAIITGNNLPELVTQRTWIKQVLMNLIGNGIKFNETNPPRVEITCYETETGYQFKVRDNGIGIPEDQHEHLFKLFQRLEHTNHYPGTGAGLSIGKKIIESLGGEIWVESQEGYGCSFIFTIPNGDIEEATGSQTVQAIHADGLVER